MSKQQWSRPDEYANPGWYPDPEYLGNERVHRVRRFDGEDWGCCSVSSTSARNRPAAETASSAAVSTLLFTAFAIPAIYFLQEFSLLMWVVLAILIGMFGSASEGLKTARLCKKIPAFTRPKTRIS